MFDEEGPPLGRRVADEGIFLGGQAKAPDVAFLVRTWIGEMKIGRGLLDQRVRLRCPRDIGRRLRAEPDDAVELADRLHLVDDVVGKDRVLEKLPALIHEDENRLAGQQLVEPVIEIHQRRRAHVLIVQDVRHVETEDPPARE